MLPAVNYENLKRVNSMVSGGSGGSDKLLRKFSMIFDEPLRRTPRIPDKTTLAFIQSHPKFGRPRSKAVSISGAARTEASGPVSAYDDRVLHDVRLHLSRSRRQKEDTNRIPGDDLMLHREKNIELLSTTLKKLPFERTRREHKAVSRLLKEMWPQELNSVTENGNEGSVLKELSKVATLYHVPEKGLTIFGNSGLHMVLKGCLTPQTLPYLRVTAKTAASGGDEFACPTPLLRRNQIRLQVGDWFGTLVKVEGREMNSKILSVLTLEPCLLLKISTSDFKRVLDKIHERLQKEKVSVVKICPAYRKWPGLSVRSLAALIEWRTFPADSIIAEEGAVAPFVAFIRRGECGVFKQVEAIKSLPNGRRLRVFKNVLMDTLGSGTSLGEHSILEGKAVACTVVSQSEVELGVITAQKLDELDVTTRTLLAQSAIPKFANISEDDVQACFIAQEMKNDWERMKHKILLNTLNHCGIRPGYGKWSHGKTNSL